MTDGGLGNQAFGAPRPNPCRAVWAQRKGPREGDPRARSSQLWRPIISRHTPFPSSLVSESLPVISNVEVRLPGNPNFRATYWTVLPVANGPFNTELNVQRRKGSLSCKTKTGLPLPHCPGALGLSWGWLLLAPQ